VLMTPTTQPGAALTDRGRAVALTFRLRDLAETLPDWDRRRMLAEVERIVATYRRVPSRKAL
jgi:hypothetical protein